MSREEDRADRCAVERRLERDRAARHRACERAARLVGREHIVGTPDGPVAVAAWGLRVLLAFPGVASSDFPGAVE